MPVDAKLLLQRDFGARVQAYGPREAIIYALGLGFGCDPMDREELNYVYEKSLRVPPTFATVLASPGFWAQEPDTGIDWPKVLHGAQSIRLHKPLPAAARVEGRLRIDGIVDKGEKGAFIHQTRTVSDVGSGDLLATLNSVTIARGDGGCGSVGVESMPEFGPMPKRPPDDVVSFAVQAQAALLYRLNGDFNPLHADPAVAADAGFRQPILHGLCTFGMAGRALLRAACGYDPRRLAGLAARFSNPVFPGETLVFEIWREEAGARFQCRVKERDVLALSHGSGAFQ
jgi:acyl dehydratase